MHRTDLFFSLPSFFLFLFFLTSLLYSDFLFLTKLFLRILIILSLCINCMNSTIPAVYREESNVLRYPGDDPFPTSNGNGNGTTSGNGNGLISCPDFELPSMVTSDDFWESALRRERSAYENILSTLHAKEVVLRDRKSVV